MKDPDTTEEINLAHGILHKFQYTYGNRWVSQKELFQENRKWTKVFNKLVKDGHIKKKKTWQGNQYRWNGPFP